MNNTVELFDDIKQRLRDTFTTIYFNSNQLNVRFDEIVADEELRECLLIIKKIAKERNEEIPPYIKDCRTVEEFLSAIYFGNQRNEDMLDDISNFFNKYSNYLEENMYQVELVKVEAEIPHKLTYTSIVRDLANCDIRVENEDYSGAITSARSVVEGVCKEIIHDMGGEVPEGKISLPKLFSILSKQLNLDPSNKKFDDSLKEIVSGFNKVIHGLTEVRNASGDSHSKKVNPSFHHAVLAVNSAKTVTSFLFHTYEYQKEKNSAILSSSKF